MFFGDGSDFLERVGSEFLELKIFDGLASRTYDAVISGTTITPGRAAIVQFSDPYLEFNQGVAVNRECTPDASAESDFRGLRPAFRLGIRRTLWPGAG